MSLFASQIQGQGWQSYKARLSALSQGFLSPPSLPFLKIYLHHTHPISLFVSTGIRLLLQKLTLPSALHDVFPWDLAPTSHFSSSPASSSMKSPFLADNTHALPSSSLSHIISVLQASRQNCLQPDFIFSPSFSSIH